MGHDACCNRGMYSKNPWFIMECYQRWKEVWKIKRKPGIWCGQSHTDAIPRRPSPGWDSEASLGGGDRSMGTFTHRHWPPAWAGQRLSQDSALGSFKSPWAPSEDTPKSFFWFFLFIIRGLWKIKSSRPTPCLRLLETPRPWEMTTPQDL